MKTIPVRDSRFPLPTNMNEINEEKMRIDNRIFGRYMVGGVFGGMAAFGLSLGLVSNTIDRIQEMPVNQDKSRLYIKAASYSVTGLTGAALAVTSAIMYIRRSDKLDREYSDALGVKSVPPR